MSVARTLLAPASGQIRREPLGTGLDQLPEDRQAALVGQGGESRHGVARFHSSRIHELWDNWKPGRGPMTEPTHTQASHGAMARRTAIRFVLLIGVLSFFADFTYEGVRSVLGLYLALLGASAATVGFVTGFGEFVDYGLRLVSGR